MRPARKLILLFLVLALPFLPCRAQNQPQTPSSLLDVLSADARQFNRLADFGLHSSSVPLDLIPTVGLVPTSPPLPAQRLFASFAAVPPKNTQPSPRYSCPPDVRIDLISACLFPPPSKFTVSEDRLSIYPVPPIQPARRPDRKIPLGAPLWQSFGFLVVWPRFPARQR